MDARWKQTRQIWARYRMSPVPQHSRAIGTRCSQIGQHGRKMEATKANMAKIS
eukprot:CAMPEP_0177324906 /NCGR_PEP_ID=MMETSP0368-20130122/17520_1 /TAXON_ID=447022 ORGANISM="Scrippsiella hangoei-like, Strain SHHI-4" /NCGR_SAMPLE_ID=MMETSP0368 /ASSEMBLY_ACC=CAM_ASM_000363 /LENGTH=52 /DNA_ID=CAMNT_0018784759 /DNA_START=309 /DNA_END=463 /DNA_ORIENTATION=+